MQDWPPPNYRPDYGTGYRVTLADFRQLLGEVEYRGTVAPLLLEWFGCTLSGARDQTQIRNPDGSQMDMEALHARTQADPKMQYWLYQRAMDLWR